LVRPILRPATGRLSVKAQIDNAIDDAEDREIAPEINTKIANDTGEITVADNHSGFPAEIIDGILDYSVRVSFREVYVSPTRGARGNPIVVKTKENRVLALAEHANCTQRKTRAQQPMPVSCVLSHGSVRRHV
jgi:hypothetical protein